MKTIDDITNFIFLESNPEKADIIFIPGGSYLELAERAAELWINEYAPLILPSGKYSIKRGYFPKPLSKSEIYSGTYNTEWDFLKDVLIKNGVDENTILREDNAQFTYENAVKSREITDKLNLHIKKAIICCKSFHARRCYMYYQWAYPDTEIIICSTEVQGINRDKWFTTKNGVEIVMGELTRCGSQLKDYIMEFTKDKL
ncbi:YdcF family protein [Clostridium estertheticum]|uniref:YdcF family protein n=1 Tax=Clostridium estertheticum TaxID=238834 RepID=UPI0013E97A1F|nr:YdcF family protein [Clostridium estertheticum]MBZ9687450.1 YdcF family protein [Clostridium estertheticum]